MARRWTVNVLAMLGVLVCVLAAPKQEKGQGSDVVRTYTQQELLNRYHQPTFIIFILIVMVVVASAYAMKERVLRRAEGDWSRVRDDAGKLTLNLAFGIMAGTLGGFNITLTKSIFQVMGGQWEDGGEDALLSSFLCWTLGISLVFTFCFQILCVIDGLEKCAALVVVPVQSVAEESCATLGGLLYFQDYTQFTAPSAVAYAFGDLLAIISVVALVRIRVRRAKTASASPKGNKEHLITTESEDIDAAAAGLLDEGPKVEPWPPIRFT